MIEKNKLEMRIDSVSEMSAARMDRDAKELRAVQEAWLLYFNEYLFGNGLITEDKRNRMVAKITERTKGRNASNRIDFR